MDGDYGYCTLYLSQTDRNRTGILFLERHGSAGYIEYNTVIYLELRGECTMLIDTIVLFIIISSH